jgi:hypothetical protein
MRVVQRGCEPGIERWALPRLQLHGEAFGMSGKARVAVLMLAVVVIARVSTMVSMPMSVVVSRASVSAVVR